MAGGGIALRYAKALFELGVEEGNARVLYKDLETLTEAYRQSDELRTIVSAPSLRVEQRKEVLRAVAQSLKLGVLVTNFAQLLVDKGRLSALEGIFTSFQRLLDEKEGIVRAQVTSAQKLAPAQLGRVKQVLARLTGKKVELETDTDPDLIGGMVARIGDKVYDGSLRNQLRRLRDAAMQEA